MIEKAIVEDLISPGSKKETLESIFPPFAPPRVREFFNFMRTHITLESKGMGVGFRESRFSLSELLEKKGFDYRVYEVFINAFEDKLLKQYSESQPKISNSPII